MGLIMASMTLAELRAEVIREGRVGSNVAATVLNAWIYEAVKKLQNDTLWLEQTRHFYSREYFTIGTYEGIGIRLTTATGTLNAIGTSGTAFANLTGSSMAQLLSTGWEGIVGDTGISFSWSTANTKFTIAIDAGTYNSTGMYVGPPSYSTQFIYDASYKFFGLTAETSVDAITYTGSVPPLCTSEYSLPDDFLYVKEVRYGGKSYPLKLIL
jgi:hypothetical protein